jgi:cytidine deaminase
VVPQSYTNYTKSPSAVSVITQEGGVYTGAFLESAAFNPSLAPFQGAWAAAVMDKVSGFDQVCVGLGGRMGGGRTRYT